ncbi:ComEC/Rec2 family competence protein [Microvirga pudoricolor]|uniref:ComEC/Rec2 family competence protein n=1 Tax=Microvirga pudoricolor TaxID=2778729 RepID=UPI001952710A|nr:ComEC/Rec2 family competence protein [Microvirga pudoricolor]MBM6595757.1 ComEC/Rec2 family competence protein [Microvirga pudoricolor]
MVPPDEPRPSRLPHARTGALALPIPLAWQAWTAPDDVRLWLGRCMRREIDQRRLFPWIAVFFGLGIVLFFQADGQPALWAPALGIAGGGAVAFGLRRSLTGLATGLALTALFAGFGAAAWRVRAVDAPILSRIVIAPISGFVETVDQRPDGKRVVLRVEAVKGLSKAERPRLVRVTIRKGEVSPGQYIEGTARLLPPPQPAWPGGYDFARDAYFKEVGAVGSMVGAIRAPAAPRDPPWSLRIAAAIDDARGALTSRIASAIGGQAGAVGAALVTGKRGLIDEATNDMLRGAGIYHIVSISGLHMVLAAGTFFWLARAGLALAPSIALRWPVKKIAALVAMAGAVIYCVFSGSEVATVRSLIMTLVMFGAILADRPALSIRNLAVAALIVLAREPEALLGPSFQMSFGAVAALVAFAPVVQVSVGDGGPIRVFDEILRWVVRAVVGLIGTTLVASIATAPFTAYHFQSLNPLGLVGNALALPLVSAVVMPSAVLGILAFPFGLDGPVWRAMGWAVARVLDVSDWVSALTGATVTVPAMSVTTLTMIGLALLIATLLVSSLRWVALIPALAGLALAAAPERFDVFIDREGAGAVVRGADGRFVLVGRPSGFVVEQWLRADGDSRDPKDKTLRMGGRCDGSGCVVETKDRLFVAFDQDIAALEEDCRRAAIVITRLKAPAGCAASLVIDRRALDAHGATALRLRDGVFEVVAARPAGRDKAWSGLKATPTALVPAPARTPAKPVPEQDLPDDEVSSGERD